MLASPAVLCQLWNVVAPAEQMDMVYTLTYLDMLQWQLQHASYAGRLLQCKSFSPAGNAELYMQSKLSRRATLPVIDTRAIPVHQHHRRPVVACTSTEEDMALVWLRSCQPV